MTKPTQNINLSPWSIGLLKSDNATRYKGYVLGEREDTFKESRVLGKRFASCMESRAKTGDYLLEANVRRLKKEFKENGAEEKIDSYVSQLYELVENAKIAIPDRPLFAEKEILIPTDFEGYTLKVKIDAVYAEYLVDHKSVTNFTKPEEWDEKYKDKAIIYQYAHYKETGEKLDIVYREIRKSKRSLPRTKADCIALLPANLQEQAEKEGWKVDKIKNHLYLQTTAEDVSQKIVFARDDNIIPTVERLISNAVRKAEWLRELQLEDVL